jgi:hypothetical protein
MTTLQEQYTEDQVRYIENLRQGRFDLSWLTDDEPVWGVRAVPKDPQRGLTLQDVNAVYAGEPEDTAPLNVMAPRGSLVEPDMPDLGYEYNDKYLVWADNVTELYEEGVSRQWSATRDIPWETLKPLPEDLERAQCQVCTVLAEVEMVASDFPARWLWRMNQHYHEVKMFLCTQAMDEARHVEIFRKRALANGGGLLRCSRRTELGLSAVLNAPTFIQGSYLMHILGEGLALEIFLAGEFLAKNEVEKEMYRLTLQDEARHVSYGTMHMKYFLEHHPDREQAEKELHAIADAGESVFRGFLLNPGLAEPLAVLAGGGVKHIDRGFDAVKVLWKRMVEGYLKRCEVAGFDRRSRIRVPTEPPF